MGPDRAGQEDVETRRRILATVSRYPGLHLREIQRNVSTSARLAEYHLNRLEDLDLVTSIQEGGYRRFFPTQQERGALSRAEKSWLGLLRQEVPLGVTLHLLEHGTARHGELLEVVDVSKSTLSHHLKKMQESGLVERRPPGTGRRLALADRDRVLALLRAHRPVPDLVSAYGRMWEAIFGVLGRRDPEDER